MVRFLVFLALCAGAVTAGEKITVIGVGRLGLCHALCLEKAGYDVLGVDLFPNYVEQLNTKTLSSPEPDVNEFLRAAKHFKATTSLDAGLAFSDLIFIVVPTNPPMTVGDYNSEMMDRLLAEINQRKATGKHLVIVSTLYPGYIRDIGKKTLSDCPGTLISYNPEFIAQGWIIKGLQNPDLILIGEANSEKGDELERVYQKLCKNHPRIARMSVESAEIMKLGLNCFVTMKIAFANLVGDIADATEGADKFAILSALSLDSRIGKKCLMPGYGFGGPCFPRDNRALGDYGQKLGIEPTLFRATDRANQLHALFMAEQFLKSGLDQYLFEDVCYKDKCPVPIIEESQKLVVAKFVAEAGKEVVIRDRKEVIEKVQAEFGDLFHYSTIKN